MKGSISGHLSAGNFSYPHAPLLPSSEQSSAGYTQSPIYFQPDQQLMESGL
jgi:hypothetical protein